MSKSIDNTISLEVIKFIRRADRKERYFTYDLKAEKMIEEGEKIKFIPSREDSYDRLSELGNEFAGIDISVEDFVIEKIMLEKLRNSMEKLSTDELTLIHALFFEDKSERQLSEIISVPQRTINDRKHRILKKLRKFIEI